MLIFIIAVSSALVISFLCSIMESVLLSLGNADVEGLARAGKPAGVLMQNFKRNIDVPIASILILNTVAHTVGATVAGASYQNAFSAESLWLFSVVFTIAVLLFTEIIPKTYGATHAKELATPVAWGIRFLSVVLYPFVWVSERISRSLRGNQQSPVTSIDEIRLLASLGHKEGVVAADIAGIIGRATRLSQLTAFDVMVPKSQVVFLSTTRTTAENLQALKKSGCSRAPFSTSTNLDEATGIVLAKELFFHLQEHADEPIDWSKLVREPLVVVETQRLTSLLATFQEARSHMALVVDEYGSIVGIVTLEDVMEEIVGDIFDESDHDSNEIWSRTDGSLEALATADIREVCNRLGVEWPVNVDFKSVGGLVTELLERLPKAGDSVEWRGHRLEVCAATANRAQRIRVSPLAAEESGSVSQTETQH